MINSVEDLEIYKLAILLAKRIYLLTQNFPKSETYGLIDQIRRAVASIGANIAEGFGRYHYKDKLLFFYNARGSLYEVKHFVRLSFELGYLNESDMLSLNVVIKDLSVKLNNFIKVIGKTTNDDV